MLRLKSRIPKYSNTIPTFQQGGLVFRDNMYMQPQVNNQLVGVLSTPKDQGFEQAVTLNKLQLAANQSTLEGFNSAITNKIRMDQLELQKQQHEDEQMRYVLKERAAYMDKITGDDIDPIFTEKINNLQNKYGLTTDRPLNMQGLAEQQKAMEAYYRDPEYRNIKEYSTLIKHTATQADKISEVINKTKLEDPENFLNYNFNEYEDKLREVRKNLINIGNGDYNQDGVLDANDMNILKSTMNEVRSIELKMTDEYKEEVKKTKQITQLTNEAKYNALELQNRTDKISLDLKNKQLDALNNFLDINEDPTATPEQKQQAAVQLAAANNKIKEVMGLLDPQDMGNAPKNEWEARWREAGGDPQAGVMMETLREEELKLKQTGSNSTIQHIKDPNGHIIGVQEGDLINKGGYYTNKKGDIVKISINGTMYNAEDILPTKDSDLKGQVLLVERNGKAYIQVPSEHRNMFASEKIRTYLQKTFGWDYTGGFFGASSGTDDAGEFFPGAKEENGLLLIPADDISLSLSYSGDPSTGSVGGSSTGQTTYTSIGGKTATDVTAQASSVVLDVVLNAPK